MGISRRPPAPARAALDPQRRQVIEVLAMSSGHLADAQIVELPGADAATVPSTVYRTLDVLEELGLVRHGHGADGRGEYLVRPADEHGHLYCAGCRRQWELSDPQVRRFVSQIERQNRFSVDLSHLTWVGRCVDCGAAEPGLVTLPNVRRSGRSIST